ncbi:MAG: cell division protein ZipA C-terminal FtsZ-binding domain-containing protein [Gammaproteobacteria bacterium]|nr:cell division protein ZipA C-terminal FtsZ-binding domain-containing protein [Gammaproteobacteria bacterium]
MDASALRWTLAIIGIVLLVGIYLYGLQQNRLRKRAARETFAREEVDSAFIEDEQLRKELHNLGRIINDDAANADLGRININPALEADISPVITEKVALYIPDLVASIDKERLISHLLMHSDHRLMTGEEINSALGYTGFDINAEGIMQYRHDDELVFWVASLSQPGHFSDLEELEFTTLGLNCFFDRGDCPDAFKNYELMLKKIDELVRLLNVKVYQSNQQLLTISDVTDIRQNLSS